MKKKESGAKGRAMCNSRNTPKLAIETAIL